MQTIIDKFNQDLINLLKCQEKERKLSENSLKKSDEIQDNSKITEQFESSQSCPFTANNRKPSFDSLSICPSQAETLSQTSESSFFVSYNSSIPQKISSKEIIPVDKKEELDKDIPFFYGVEEYFKKLMPEKFISYTQTKNYLHKNSFIKGNNYRDNIIKKNEDNYNQEYMQFQNYYFCPIFYYPINNFYYNHNYNNFIQKPKNTKNYKVKKDKPIQNNKKENEDKKENEETDKNDNIQKIIDNGISKDDNKEVEDEINKSEISHNPINKEEVSKNNSYKKYYNQKRNKEYNYYKKTSFYNKKNSKIFQRQYNKYSNYFYDENAFYEEKTRNYYTNNYNKRKYQRPYENKFYGYK